MLVNSGIYANGIRTQNQASTLDAVQIPDPDQTNTFAWVALKDVTPAELDTLQNKLRIPGLISEDLAHGNQL